MNNIYITEKSILDKDAQILICELNSVLKEITGADGTASFSFSDVETEESAFLIAYIDEKPTGCGAFRKISNDVAEIKRVYARRNNVGIGSKIVEALEDKARNLGYKKIVLETRVQNKRAIEFYKKLGYQQCDAYGKYIGKSYAYCFEKN